MKIYSDRLLDKEINDLCKWFELCPPKEGIEQWKDYRSAKEMAKFWLDQKNCEEFQQFIRKTIPDFTYDHIIPESASIFDRYRSPRKHDLYIAGKDNKSIITIEGKADESFGNNDFEKELNESIKEKIKKPNSKKFDRMIELYLNYFNNNGYGYIFGIMYQLLHWFAGSKSDAIRIGTNNFIMVLQEFKSNETDDKKQQKNHSDFENFIDFISEAKYKSIKNKQIIGPISNKYTSDNKKGNMNLYIGYYSIDLRN